MVVVVFGVVVLAVDVVDFVVPLIHLVTTAVVVGERRKTNQLGICLTVMFVEGIKRIYCFLI